MAAAAPAPKSAPEGKKVTIEIQMEEGDPLGATLDDKLHIVRIQPMTIADGKLLVGDQFLSVNNTKVENRNHFYQLLRYAPPCATIEVVRGGTLPESETQTDSVMPPERERLIDRRAGFDYFLTKVKVIRGKRLGLGIRDVSNRVLVSKVEKGTLTDGKLAVRDHIIDVEGTRVTDKGVARELLIRSMRQKGYFTCVVGRPVTDDAKRQSDDDLSVKNDPPSVKMSDDVRMIAQQQRQREQQVANAQRGSLLAVGTAKERPRVSFAENRNNQFEIGNDNKGKNLRPVRK